ncbi:MAG: hypothetical protein IKK25_08310, partial [Lentisphaeria bacterium]|nr:hypothetical protein [Lentisphaeria bacterium]
QQIRRIVRSQSFRLWGKRGSSHPVSKFFKDGINLNFSSVPDMAEFTTGSDTEETRRVFCFQPEKFSFFTEMNLHD